MLLQQIKRVTLITSQIIKTQKINANLMNCDLPQEKVNAEEGYFAVMSRLGTLLYENNFISSTEWKLGIKCFPYNLEKRKCDFC